MKKFDIRDPQNEIIKKAYEGDKNYQVIDNDSRTGICYIFFSSNGLYYPDTNEVFEEQIIKKNRYEWKWVVKNSTVPEIAERIIYVRDVWKQWYSRGINSIEDTVDKTLDLMRRLTEGYRIVTVGSSAGGYMAVLAAVKLNAEYCINFSGQYIISETLGNPYIHLPELLKGYGGQIFYFVPTHCEADQEAYRSVKDCKCICPFLFDDAKHASTMLTGNMSYIIGMNRDLLLNLYSKNQNKEINKFIFLIQTVPPVQVFSIMLHEIKGFIRRKIGKHWNGI